MARHMDFAPEEVSWLRVVARCALVTAGVDVVLFAAFFSMGFDASVPQEYAELVGASRHLATYRLTAALDALVWLAMGATLLAFAGLFARRTPRRAAFLAACAAGQLLGALGGYLRLYPVSDLATRYAAATPDQQTALVQAYLTVAQTYGAHYGAGQLLYGAGYLLVASAALAFAGFPRWLAGWFALSGAYAVVEQVVNATGSTVFFALFPLYTIVGIMALHVATAAVFWRRGVAPAVAPGVAAAPAAVAGAPAR